MTLSRPVPLSRVNMNSTFGTTDQNEKLHIDYEHGIQESWELRISLIWADVYPFYQMSESVIDRM